MIDLAAAVAADPAGETTAGRRSKLLLQAIAEAAVEAERTGKLEASRKS